MSTTFLGAIALPTGSSGMWCRCGARSVPWGFRAESDLVELLHRYSRLAYMITTLVRAKKGASTPRKPGRSNPSPVPVRKRVPKHLHQEIITSYQAGATTRQLAQHYGVCKTNIENLLHRANVPMRNQPLTPNQVSEAIQLRAQGLSTYKIAERFGVVQSTVWRAFQQSDSKSRPTI
jgi:transposase-like protein